MISHQSEIHLLDGHDWRATQAPNSCFSKPMTRDVFDFSLWIRLRPRTYADMCGSGLFQRSPKVFRKLNPSMQKYMGCLSQLLEHGINTTGLEFNSHWWLPYSKCLPHGGGSRNLSTTHNRKWDRKGMDPSDWLRNYLCGRFESLHMKQKLSELNLINSFLS